MTSLPPSAAAAATVVGWAQGAAGVGGGGGSIPMAPSTSNSKYAHLPDIDHGREVFETPDIAFSRSNRSSTGTSTRGSLPPRPSAPVAGGPDDGNTYYGHDDDVGDEERYDEDEDAEIVRSSVSISTASTRFTAAANNARRRRFRSEPDHNGRFVPILGHQSRRRRARFVAAKAGILHGEGGGPLTLPETEEYSIVQSHRYGSDDDEPETLVQRLRRLIYEVDLLGKDAEKEKEKEREQVVPSSSGPAASKAATEPASATDSGQKLKATAKNQISPVELLSRVQVLQSELTRIGSVMSGGPDPIMLTEGGPAAGTLTKHVEAQKSLIADIAEFKAKRVMDIMSEYNAAAAAETTNHIDGSKQAPNQGQSASIGAGITYELFYTPENARLTQLSQLSELETRLTTLERLIGVHVLQGQEPSANEDPLTSVFNTAGNLVSAIDRLEHHLALLTQPRRLDNVARRVKIVTSDMERVLELRKKHQIESHYNRDHHNGASSNIDDVNMHATQTETERRVNYLFTSLEKLDPIIGVVPHLIARLQALRTLHNEAAAFSESLRLVADEQIRVLENTKTIHDTLKKLDINMHENAVRVEKNVAALNERITALVEARRK